MGVIRWSAKGMKLLGEVLDSDDVERWLLDKGQSIIEAKLTQMPARWLAGNYRAKKSVRQDLLLAINGSESLRLAVESKLAHLPEIVHRVARDVRTFGPYEAHSSDSRFDVVMCPRELVRRRYAKWLLDELGSSAVFNRCVGMPNVVLTRLANASEEAFFAEGDRAQGGTQFQVVGADAQEDLRLGGTPGVYWVGLVLYPTQCNLEEKKDQRLLAAFAPQAKRKISDAYVALKAGSMAGFSAKFEALLTK